MALDTDSVLSASAACECEDRSIKNIARVYVRQSTYGSSLHILLTHYARDDPRRLPGPAAPPDALLALVLACATLAPSLRIWSIALSTAACADPCSFFARRSSAAPNPCMISLPAPRSLASAAEEEEDEGAAAAAAASEGAPPAALCVDEKALTAPPPPEPPLLCEVRL